MRNVLLHGHIFKNAGTTLDWSLARSFGDQFLDHRRDDLMRQHGSAHVVDTLNDSPDLQAISSHHMPQMPGESDGYRFHRLYLLRHPMLRVRSVYEFEREQEAETPGARAAKEKDLKEYVDWRMQRNVGPTIRNFQCRYLAGRFAPGKGKLTDLEYFSAAMQALREVEFIGVVEMYDESMVMAERLLRPIFPDIDLAHVPQNVSRSGRDTRSPEEKLARLNSSLGDLQKTLLDNNSYDLALYQMGLARLEEEISNFKGFRKALTNFQRRCTRLSRFKRIKRF